jgi:hypothetical protein
MHACQVPPVQPLSPSAKSSKLPCVPTSPHLTSTPTRHLSVTPTLLHAPPPLTSSRPRANCRAATAVSLTPSARTARPSSRAGSSVLGRSAHERKLRSYKATTAHPAVARRIAPSASEALAGSIRCAWFLVRGCVPQSARSPAQRPGRRSVAFRRDIFELVAPIE